MAVFGEKYGERFVKPTDEELIKFALIFNDGKLDAEELTNMVAMAALIIDRLYENGICSMPTEQEMIDNIHENL